MAKMIFNRYGIGPGATEYY